MMNIAGLLLIGASYACAGDAPQEPLNDPQDGRLGGVAAFIEVTPTLSHLEQPGETVELSARVRDSRGRSLNGRWVRWTSLHPQIVTVDDQGRVTGVSKGEGRVMALVDGVSDTAEVVVRREAAVASVVVTPGDATIDKVGGTVALTAQALDAHGNALTGRTITWASLDGTIASVTSGGSVLGLKAGKARIVASHGALADTALVQVATPTAASIEIVPQVSDLTAAGAKVQLSTTIRDVDGNPITATVAWGTLDPAVATVQNGLVTALAEGVARVTAKTGTLLDTAFVRVGAAAGGARITLTPKLDTIPAVGGTIQLSAEVVGANGAQIQGASVVWSSLTPSIVAVTGNGTVAGVTKGTGRVVARYSTLADTATIVVAPAPAQAQPAAVRVTPDAGTLDAVGATMQLSAAVVDAQDKQIAGTAVQWASLNAAAATVDGTGKVTGVAKGTARIIASHLTLKDTAVIEVTPAGQGGTASFEVRLHVDPDTIVNAGVQLEMEGPVFDAAGNPLYSAGATWTSLNPTIVQLQSAGPSRVIQANALAAGTAVVIATYNGAADTARVHVNAPPAAQQPAAVKVTPATATITASATTTALTGQVLDASGKIIPGLSITWTSLDPAVASVSNGTVTRVGSGTARIRAAHGAFADTAIVQVDKSTAGLPAVITVSSKTASMWVGGTLQLSASVKDASNLIVPGVTVTWQSLDNGIASVNANGVVTGAAAGTARIVASHLALSDTAHVSVQKASTGTGLITAANMMATAGALIARPSSQAWPISGLDKLYAGAEQNVYDNWVAGGRKFTDASSHYGALRSRYQWSVRNGLPVGPSAPSNSMYKHGVEMTRAVIKDYFKPNNFNIAPHNNTNLADVEMLYLLEGDADALAHIAGSARFYSLLFSENYFNLSGSSSEPRATAILMQAANAAARLNVPYTGGSRWGATSWKGVGAVAANWVQSAIQADGKLISHAHKNSNQGDEAFFMNAMVATELLRWHGFVEPQPGWVTLAQRLIDHLIDERDRRGLPCLPYTSFGKSCATDLAAFYVWPSLVVWQETGDAKYRQFALDNIDAARGAFIVQAKQFNQTFSTGAQSIEALLAGVSWR